MENTMNQIGAPAAMGFGQYLRTIPTPSNPPTYSHHRSEGSGQESSNQAATQRTKWSKPKDPSLIQVYGSKEIALDAEEFPEACPPNLCAEDRKHWKRLRETLLVDLPAHESSFKTDKSFRSRFSHIRKDLRGLQAVSDGTSARFGIKDHQIRAKQRAATRTRGLESGRDDGHQIRKARRNRPKVITHEDRLREQAYRALGLLPDPEAPIDPTHQELPRDQFAPGNIHDIGANGGFSQAVHERSRRPQFGPSNVHGIGYSEGILGAVNPDPRRPQMAPSNVHGIWRNEEALGVINQGSHRLQLAPSNMHTTGRNEWVSGTFNQGPYWPQLAPGNAYGMRQNEEVWRAVNQERRPQIAPSNMYGMRPNEVVWGAVHQGSYRPQIVPSNIYGMGRNEEVSAVEKGPGQVLHERVGWMGVVQGPNAICLRGNGSRGYPIMLD